MGVDPTRYTLRKLKWMADRKREHDYDVAVQLALNVGEVFLGRFDPAKANPIRYSEVLQNQSDGKEGFSLLGAGLKAIAQGG